MQFLIAIVNRLQEDLKAPLLPEMVFGHNFVKFTHMPSNLEVSFDATESLSDWSKNCQLMLRTLKVGQKSGKEWYICI